MDDEVPTILDTEKMIDTNSNGDLNEIIHGSKVLNSANILVQEMLSNLEINQEDELQPLYEYCLEILFRIMFLLHAEASSRLPVVHNSSKEIISMEHILSHLEERNMLGEGWDPEGGVLWDLFHQFSNVIHDRLGGSLFNQSCWDECHVSDDVFAEVLLLVSHTTSEGESTGPKKLVRIPYQEIEIEIFGSIYETLLEYSPIIAEQRYVWDIKQGWPIPTPDPEQKLHRDFGIEPTEIGDFALIPGDERFVTGSHYTPSTLTAILVKKHLDRLVIGKNSYELIDLLTIDPAMGSAAFLIQYVRDLAGRYAELVAQEIQDETFDFKYSHSDSEWLEEDDSPLAHSTRWGGCDPLSEEAIFDHRRLILERCVYGVDLNPMAVKLAKYSLWLLTVNGDVPLTFLDAHLKCGNSLVGGKLRNICIDEESLNSTDWPKLAKANNNYLGEIKEGALESAKLGRTDLQYKLKNAKKKQKFLDHKARLGSEQKTLFAFADDGGSDESLKTDEEEISEDMATRRADFINSMSFTPYTLPWLDVVQLLEELSLQRSALRSTRQHTIDSMKAKEEGFNQIEYNSKIRQFLKELLDLACASWWWPTQKEVVENDLSHPLISSEINSYAIWLANDLGILEDIESICGEIPEHMKSTQSDVSRYQIIRDMVRKITERELFFHWELEFPEILIHGLDNGSPGFNSVNGNPPFIDSETMVNNFPRAREFMASMYESASGNWDMFVPFVEKFVSLSRFDGYVGSVIPLVFFSSDYSAKIHEQLFEHNRVLECMDFTERNFFSAVSIPIGAVLIQTGVIESEDSETSFITYRTEEDDIINTTTNATQQNLPPGYVSIFFNPSFDVAALFDSDLPRLRDVCTCTDGATTSEAYLIAEHVRDAGEDEELGPESIRLVNTGTIDPYRLLWGESKISYLGFKGLRPVISDTALAEINPRRLEQARIDKVVVGGMGKIIEAAVAPVGVLCGKSTVQIVPREDICPYALAAVLNSTWFNELYKAIYGGRGFGEGSMNIGPRQIECMPTPPSTYFLEGTDEFDSNSIEISNHTLSVVGRHLSLNSIEESQEYEIIDLAQFIIPGFK